MRTPTVRISLVAVSLLLLGVAISAAGPVLPSKYVVRAEMTVRPNGLAIDTRGRIWLALQNSPPAESSAPALGVVDSSACARTSECEPTRFPIPDDDAVPELITVDQDGNVWLTASRAGGGRVYKFDPDTEVFVTYAAPGSKPYDIAVDSRGTAWFTDFEQGTVNSIGGAGLVIEEYRTPAESLNWSHTGALGIAVDSSGAAWCACGDNLVRILKTVTTPVAKKQVDVYPIPDPWIPHGVFAETPNHIWIMDQGWNWKAGRLIRFTRGCRLCLVPDDTFEAWPLPERLEDGAAVMMDPHWLVVRSHTVHFTAFAGFVGTFNAMGETFGGYVVSPARAAMATGAYDIAIDPAGRVWFTEVNPTPALSRVDSIFLRPFVAPMR